MDQGQSSTSPLAALLDAITIMGSQEDLAKGLGITGSAISQWKRVPVERCPEIERLTGVPRERLRPDIFARPIRRGRRPDHFRRDDAA